MLKFILPLFLIQNTLCYKQLKMSPTSFSITQQHPAVGSDNSINHGDSSTGSSHSHQEISFHSNSFPSDTSETSILNSNHNNDADDDDVQSIGSILPGYGGEGRILSSGKGTSYYGKKLFEVAPIGDDQCSIDKYALEHEGTIQYEQSLPKLDQFTLCAWMRFTNHSGDHSIFTYSNDADPREIQFWIANSMGASYISLAVHGQSLYRLNYPLKMRKWHHACTSWNGKTGEWQLWIKAERVGRGFHNRIVGHVIKPHGILFSGGPSITGPIAEGLHMELTMVQMYKVALSAGKAHRDHKHHHVHHFNHEGVVSTTQAPLPPPPMQMLPVNPLLANGQIATRLRINFAGVQPAINPQPGVPSQVLAGLVPTQHQATVGTQFVSGQFSPAERLISTQLVARQIQQTQGTQQFKFPDGTISSAPTSYANVGDPANVQYLDGSNQDDGTVGHLLYKRKTSNGEKVVRKRATTVAGNKKHEKRALVTLTDGSVIDDRIIASNPFDFDGLAQFGAPTFQENLMKSMDIEDEIKEHDREPAEGEVQAVMELCSLCDTEPFRGAVILAWQNVKIQLEHALQAKSLGGCGRF